MSTPATVPRRGVAWRGEPVSTCPKHSARNINYGFGEKPSFARFFSNQDSSLFCPPELWNDGLHSRKNKKKDPFCPVKKKKPVVVSDILLFLYFHLVRPRVTLPICCRRTTRARLTVCFHLNATATAVYRLHAAGPGHPGGLDRNQKGFSSLFLGNQRSVSAPASSLCG